MAGHDAVYDVATFMYDWGFKRGMACQKAKAKKGDVKKEGHKRG